MLLSEKDFNSRIDSLFTISGKVNSLEYKARCNECDFSSKSSLRGRRVAHIFGKVIPTEGLSANISAQACSSTSAGVLETRSIIQASLDEYTAVAAAKKRKGSGVSSPPTPGPLEKCVSKQVVR